MWYVFGRRQNVLSIAPAGDGVYQKLLGYEQYTYTSRTYRVDFLKTSPENEHDVVQIIKPNSRAVLGTCIGRVRGTITIYSSTKIF